MVSHSSAIIKLEEIFKEHDIAIQHVDSVSIVKVEANQTQIVPDGTYGHVDISVLVPLKDW